MLKKLGIIIAIYFIPVTGLIHAINTHDRRRMILSIATGIITMLAHCARIIERKYLD